MARCLANSKTAEAKQIPAPPSACPCSLPPTALHSTKAEKEINTEVPAEPRWETLGVRELGENPDSYLGKLMSTCPGWEGGREVSVFLY